MKPMLRLLLLACLLPVLPTLASQPADAAQTCNQKCTNQYLACKSACHGTEGCLETCAQNRADCLCFRCGVC